MSAITPTSTTANVPRTLRAKAQAGQNEVDVCFSDFRTFGEPSLTAALQEAKRFCDAMRSATTPAYWLTFLGPSGTGKTKLARSCATFMGRFLDGYLDENQSIKTPEGHWTKKIYRKGGMKPWADVLAEMIAGDFTGMRNLSDDWLVGLDDIGAEYGGNRELSVSKIYDVLNHRAGKFTIITANYDLQTLGKKLDTRIASRLIRDGSVVVDVTAIDYNLR